MREQGVRGWAASDRGAQTQTSQRLRQGWGKSTAVGMWPLPWMKLGHNKAVLVLVFLVLYVGLSVL